MPRDLHSSSAAPPPHDRRQTSPQSAFVPARGLWFGGDYNPEQWSRDVWLEDVELMRRAKVTTATVGVFSWSLLEPSPGAFAPEWLDDVLELLAASGIDVVLATPTASPPPWFGVAHPDALPVGPDGVRRWHGSRDGYCASAPAYRSAALRIAMRLAERYATHPAVVGWHVHNEYGTVCWCDHVAAAFRRWLQRRYVSLDGLNEAWGTAFWSQRYQRWSEILPPRSTQYLHNPAHSVDFRRFFSDELLDRFREQRDVIKAAGSTAPVTTNFMLPTWNDVEQWSWSAQEDVVSLDHYLDTAGPDGEAHVAYAADLARSWARGKPWLLMEQSASSITVSGRTTFKAPDRMLRNSLSYVARGSQGALFFQWRQSTAGAETWHGALLPHAGADTDTFRAACELGDVLERLAPIAEPPTDGPVVRADVAILWHADGWWALETDGLPAADLSYPDAVRRTHRSLYRAGLPVDFVAPGDDLAAYRLVLVPSLYGLDDRAVATLEKFVARGGHLVVGYLTGVADQIMRVVPGGYPGRLRSLLGVRATRVNPVGPEVRMSLSDGSSAEAWCEHVELRGAVAAALYSDGPEVGGPAITSHNVGTAAGRAVYLSTRLLQDDLDRFVAAAAAAARVRRVLDCPHPDGVEVVRRRGAIHDLVIVLNHDLAPLTVGSTGRVVVGVPGRRTLVAPGGYLVVQVPTDAPTPLTGWSLQRPTSDDRVPPC